MRTYLLIFSTLGLLGGAFCFYWRSQPPASTTAGSEIHVAEPPPNPTVPKLSKIGPGDRPWVRMIDAAGKVSSQYRAEEYTPRPDGTVHLSDVETDFFVGLHQRLHVTGADGDVVMHGASNGLAGGSSQPSGQPTRGRLNDVKMTLIDDSLSAGSAPLLTMTTNNIEFDNDSFLITTGGYTAPDNTAVPPDQVPVQVRGEYDFDGRGLTLRWNDQDDRLELLEIAHGEELRIMHPSNRDAPGAGVSSQSESTSSSSKLSDGLPNAAAPPAGPRQSGTPTTSITPASFTAPSPPAAPAAVVSAGGKKPPRGSKPVYLATFERSVRVTQGDQLLMTGDRMLVHFRMKETQPESNSKAVNSGSGTPATVQQLSSASAGSSPSLGRGQRTAGAPANPPSAQSSSVVSSTPSPSTSGAASDVPIVVRWAGKLRIVPEQPASAPTIAAGDGIMELIGEKSPVFVFRAASEDSPASDTRCTTLAYATADGSAKLGGSDAFGPVLLTRHALPSSTDDDPPPPTVITTDNLNYRGNAHEAQLGGHGHAVIPVATNPGEKPATIDAKWSKLAVLDFLPHGKDEMAIQTATFNGDVVIVHPQLGLTAQQLRLFFSPPDGAAKAPGSQSAALSEVIANDFADHVHCEIRDAAGKRQTIECQALDLHTARTSDGRVLARQVDAAGHVLAFDDTQKINCDRVRMLLRPAIARAAAQPQQAPGGVDTSTVELERLDARGNVVVTSKDNSRAQSEQLLVANDTDGPKVMMTGDTLSKVTDAKGNQLTGEEIVIQPRQQLAHVVGNGTIYEVGEPARGASTGPATGTRKMVVIFGEGADLDGERNQINLRGNCEATMPDSDGTINSAHADRIHIALQDKPKATTQVAAAPRPPSTTQPGDEANLLGNKEPRTITLDGNALVQSNLSDSSGILRQSELKAPVIIYGVCATPEIPGHTLVVPSAGVMLVRDHRPPVRTAGSDDSGLGTGRGATAFKWGRRLVYSEDTRRAVMSGDVVVVHESDNPQELPVRLTSDQMTALFQPTGTKKPSSSQPTDSQAMELQSMEAVGNVVVNRDPSQINAQRVYFEPASHWMTAQGTLQSPVTVIDQKGAQSSVDEVRWNTQTWDFAMKHATGMASR